MGYIDSANSQKSNANRKHEMGPGAVEGHWLTVNHSRPSPDFRMGKVSYHAGAYVDNGMGTHGWIPLHGVILLDDSHDVEAVDVAVREEIDSRLDDLVLGGGIDRYLPGYSETEDSE
jgi:hypothetical protein